MKIDIIKGNKEPNYYNDNIIRDKINTDGISLNQSGHRVLDTIPTEEYFKKKRQSVFKLENFSNVV